MSNLALINQSESLIKAQASKFMELAKSHKAVNFEREALFAIQAIKGNYLLLEAAGANPDSLINSIHNIAAVGLSLNPALKHAHLVPRDKKVCLDFGFKGLVHLPVEAGSLLFVQAEIVYEKDKFILRGRGEEPIHERDPFATDRGAIRGAYCIAKTKSGDFIVETMSLAEIFAIRDKTPIYASYIKYPKKENGTAKTPPIWITNEGEMIKKTVIRRASKSWPMSNAGRFEKAMQIHDEIESVETIDVTPVSEEMSEIEEPKRLNEVREVLKSLNKEEPKFIAYLAKTNRRKIESLEDLSEDEITRALTMLYDLSAKANKEKEAVNA